MWIRIPSAYAPDTEGSNSDLEKLSKELERSVTWKTKSRSAKSWLRELKKDSLMTHLSGLTLEPSMRQRGVEKFISSLEAFHASPIVSQENRKGQTTQENSQEKYSVLQTNLGDQLSFLKMFPESDSSGGTTSDPDYKTWATGLRNALSQRKKQALLTAEKGCSCSATNWRTVSSTETEGGVKDFSKKQGLGGQSSQLRLRDQVASWPQNFPTVNTMDGMAPRSSEGNMKLYNGHRKLRTSPSNLREFVHPESWPQNFPTPNSSEHKFRLKGDTQASKTLETTARKLSLSFHQAQVIHEDGSSCTPNCRRLSPVFAEWLMGIPRGWTRSSEPLAMESYQQWQHSLGEYLARDL